MDGAYTSLARMLLAVRWGKMKPDASSARRAWLTHEKSVRETTGAIAMKQHPNVLRVLSSIGNRHRFGAFAVMAWALFVGPHVAMAQPETGPNAASALAADDDLSKKIRENDADGIAHWLDAGWAVVSANGGLGEGPSIFPDGIKSGALTRTTFETSDPRVRVYDNVA